jgi:ferredoxin
MKVSIDRDGCIQCGVCEQVCGDVFVLDGGEPAAVVEQYRKAGPAEGEIPDNLVDCASQAAESCPVTVITVA